MSISIGSLIKILLNEWLSGQFQVFWDVLHGVYFCKEGGQDENENQPCMGFDDESGVSDVPGWVCRD